MMAGAGHAIGVGAVAGAPPAQELHTLARKLSSKNNRSKLKDKLPWSGKRDNNNRLKKGSSSLRNSTSPSGSGVITRTPLTLDIILTVPERPHVDHLHADPDLKKRKAQTEQLKDGIARKDLQNRLQRGTCGTFTLILRTKETDKLDADYADFGNRPASGGGGGGGITTGGGSARPATAPRSGAAGLNDDSGAAAGGGGGAAGHAAAGQIKYRCSHMSIRVTKIKTKRKCEYGVTKASLHVVRDPRYFFWKLMLVQCALTTASFSLLMPGDMDNR